MGEAASWHDDYRLARAFAVKPVAPQSGAPPAGRWGLTAQRGLSKGDLHAINSEGCASAYLGQGNPLVMKMITAVDRHCLHYPGWHAAVHSDRDRLDLLDRLVESWLHVADLETNRDGKVIIRRARTSPVGSLLPFNFAD